MHPSQEESQDVQDLELLKQQAEKILYDFEKDILECLGIRCESTWAAAAMQ